MKRLRLAVLLLLAACGGQEAKAPTLEVNTPIPDCEPQQCSSLRIIDGNAEAYRVDSQKQ